MTVLTKMTSPSHHHTVTTSLRQNILWHPRDDDIICGRGPTRHPGNRMYHALVNACKKQYRALPLGQKKLLARSIVDALRPSRFLIKQETKVKPTEDEGDQLPYQCIIFHDNNNKRNCDDACGDKVETSDICMSATAISQFESFESHSSNTAFAATPTGSGTSTPQQEGVYYYYVVLDHEAAIRKTSQALREKGGSSGNATAHDRESGGVAVPDNNEAKETKNDGDHEDDCRLYFPHDIFDEHDDENHVNEPAIKKPRRAYGAVATLGTLSQLDQKDRVATFAPMVREELEREVELRFSHIKDMLNNTRSKQSAESDHHNVTVENESRPQCQTTSAFGHYPDWDDSHVCDHLFCDHINPKDDMQWR